ncbi:MAG: zinc ribbon domain-containing protein [Armatimonadetes bacterium]|nr:zinc ribbon domain-containing protein [Armatimonadota bacterium]
MNCPQCQMQAPPGDKYCRECGTRLPQAVAQVTSPLPEEVPVGPSGDPAIVAAVEAAKLETAAGGGTRVRRELHPHLALALGLGAALIVFLGGLVWLRASGRARPAPSPPGVAAGLPQPSPAPFAPTAPAATGSQAPASAPTAPVQTRSVPPAAPNGTPSGFRASAPVPPTPAGIVPRTPATPRGYWSPTPSEIGRAMVPAVPMGVMPLPSGGGLPLPSPTPTPPTVPTEHPPAHIDPVPSSGYIYIEPVTPPARPEDDPDAVGTAPEMQGEDLSRPNRSGSS